MRAAFILRARGPDSACKLRHLDAHRPSKHPDGGCANVNGRPSPGRIDSRPVLLMHLRQLKAG